MGLSSAWEAVWQNFRTILTIAAASSGVHGASPEALAAYQAVRLPQAGAVQRESVQASKLVAAGGMGMAGSQST